MDNIIGLDAGCAYIKVVSKDKNGDLVEFSVPSLAKHGKATVGMGSISGVSYECEGEEWSINPSLMGCEDTRFDEYPFTEMNAVLSVHALIGAGFEGQSVNIASGLPINQYYAENTPDLGNINRKHNNYFRKVRRLQSGQFRDVKIEMDSKLVCPESIAAWADICLDKDGNPTHEVSQPVGLVDIGGRTTDIAVVVQGLNFEVEQEFTGTLKTGYLDVLEKLNEYISEKYSVGKLEIAVLDQSLREGEITLGMGEPVNIQEEIKNAKKVISNGIMREVGRRFTKVSQMAGVCYFGGGAENMREELKELQHDVIIPERTQFSNARGYLKIAQFRK